MDRAELIRQKHALARIELLLNLVPKDGKYTKLWINAEDVDVFLEAIKEYKTQIERRIVLLDTQKAADIVWGVKSEEIMKRMNAIQTSGFREKFAKAVQDLAKDLEGIFGKKEGENDERGTGSTDT